MEVKTAKSLIKVFNQSSLLKLISKDKQLENFHQWSKGKDHLATFQSVKDGIYFQFIDWRENENYYLVIFPKEKNGPILEIHEFNEETNTFSWKYSPSKRDKKNPKRIEVFNSINGSKECIFTLPFNDNDLHVFLNDITKCAQNRLSADSLSDEFIKQNTEEIPTNSNAMDFILHSKNTILYGPPGTGKTYSTKMHALRIITKEVGEEETCVNESFVFTIEEKQKIATKIKENIITFSRDGKYSEIIRKDYIQFRLWDSVYTNGAGLHFEIWLHEFKFMLDYEPLNDDVDKKTILKAILNRHKDKFPTMGATTSRSSIGKRFISPEYETLDSLIPDFVEFVRGMMNILTEEGFFTELKNEGIL